MQEPKTYSGPHRLDKEGRAPGYATMIVAQKGSRTPQSRGATLPQVNAVGQQVIVKQ